MRNSEEGTPLPKNIDEYLFSLPENKMLALENLRVFIRSLAPEAEETIHYHIPTFKYRGRALVGFAAFKKHLSFFVMSSPPFLEQFKEDLALLKYDGATIQFQPENPLPDELVQKIVLARMAQNEVLEKKKK